MDRFKIVNLKLLVLNFKIYISNEKTIYFFKVIFSVTYIFLQKILYGAV